MKLNFVFFGTGEEAVYALNAMQAKGFIPKLVVTAPDHPVGRKQIITPPLAKQWAVDHFVSTFQPEKIDQAAIEMIAEENAYIFIVVGYGRILPQALIDTPKYKTLNVHTSLLPLYRGPTPIEGPILAGDTETGITIMLIDAKADHGPIILQEKYLLTGNETTPELTKSFFTRGGELLADILPDWIAGKITTQEQNHSQATYMQKLKKENGLVDPEKDSPEILWRKYRAYLGWPGIYFMKDGKRIKITEASLEMNNFAIKKVIPEGKKNKIRRISETRLNLVRINI